MTLTSRVLVSRQAEYAAGDDATPRQALGEEVPGRADSDARQKHGGPEHALGLVASAFTGELRVHVSAKVPVTLPGLGFDVLDSLRESNELSSALLVAMHQVLKRRPCQVGRCLDRGAPASEIDHPSGRSYFDVPTSAPVAVCAASAADHVTGRVLETAQPGRYVRHGDQHDAEDLKDAACEVEEWFPAQRGANGTARS
jgi:hypothetical protein